jgi:nucleoside-diphosphate-sugar epimerase
MITVLGASGFIGSNIVNKLTKTGEEVYAPKRGENFGDRNLGDIIYSIGMTADFRTKPFETVAAHICVLNEILKECSFNSLTYLSSTRVYINATKKNAEEEDKILVDPANADELYTLTKLTGERLCLSSGRNVKVVRLSNIIGNDFNSDNFLTDIVRRINKKGAFTLFSTLSSAKDYLFIDDAVDLLIKIALAGKEKVYNVASGKNSTNEEIINELKKNLQFSYQVSENAKEIKFPEISVKKINTEFDFKPTSIAQQISTLLKQA